MEKPSKVGLIASQKSFESLSCIIDSEVEANPIQSNDIINNKTPSLVQDKAPMHAKHQAI